MSVYNKFTATPLKVRGPAATYADWKFAYQPATAAPQKPAPKAKPAALAAR